MNADASDGEDFDRLAESFITLLRNGERPSLSEYAERHPALAGKIFELFPALVEMEMHKPGSGGLTGSFVGHAPSATVVGAPERLGDYRILREIGSGGMGVVYEAERESLKAHVALKVLNSRYADGSLYRARFRNEARSAARMHHTNIVQVFDFGEHEGTLYYAMQYISGQGLDRVLRDVQRLRKQAPVELVEPGDEPTLAEALHTGKYHKGSTTPGEMDLAHTLAMTSQPTSYFSQRTNDIAEEAAETTSACNDSDPTSSPQISTLAGPDRLRYHREVARIGAEVADALDYAHRRGVLHRDIKPSNLLLDAHGTVWVTDFGLAKFEGSENLTETNDLVGTLRYMAPERFDGKSDARCDIYSLGVSLYEMLALRPAFDDSNQALLIRRVLHDTPTPLRTHDTQVSLDLSTVIHKAMAREPSDRFATAAELADELRRVISNRPIKSRHASPIEQYWRWCQRNKLLAGLNALAASLTITIAVISTVAAVWLNRSYGELNRSTLEVKKQLAIAKNAENQKSEQLWEAKVAQARASRFTRRPGRRFDALAVLEEAAKLSRQLGHPTERFDILRNEAIACMALDDVRQVGRFGSHRSDSFTFDVDEAFDRYACADRLGNVTVRRVADDTELYRLDGFDSGSETRVNLSPDGRSLLVFSNNHQFKLWRLDGPRAVLLLVDSVRSACQFSADSRQLAFVSSRVELTLLDCVTGQRRVLLAGPAPIYWIAIHPDGRQLAVGVVMGQKFAVQVRNLDDPTPTATLPMPGEVHFLAWNPDGRRLVAACSDQKLYVWDMAQPRAIVLEGHKNSGILAAFNHRGDLLASNDWSGVLRLWDPRTGKQVLNSRFGHQTLRFSQDDRHLNAWDASGLGVLEVATSREYRTLAGDPTRGSMALNYFSFFPDGRVIASGTYNGIRFWNPATGEELPHIASPNPMTVGFPAGSPEMLTCGPTGLYRWRLRTDRDGGVTRVGPPEPLLDTGSIMQMAHSRDGRVVGLAGIAPGALLLHRGSPPRSVPIGPQVDVRTIAVSPDGRWAATGSHNGNEAGAFVWDAATGRKVAVLPVGDRIRIGFSPDGQWLATDGGGATRLWAVGTWKPGLTVEGLYPRFSPDSAMLALVKGDVISLVDSTTGRELAALDAPDLDRPTYTEFSPDGTCLAATSEDRDSLYIWDLRSIRSQLAALGLDWDRASYPPETKPAGAVKFTIIDPPDPDAPLSRLRHLLAPWRKGGTADARDYVLRGDELVRLGWHGLALWDYDATVRRFPGQSEVRMHRGLERFRRGYWEAAAADFRAVIAGGTKEPFIGPARCRLAWAYHELGRDADAATELGNLLELSPASWKPPDRASILLLRAEFYEQAGKLEQARADRAQAAKAAPKLAEAANTRAWNWLMPPSSPTPAENWRFPPAALVLARKAVELAPDEPMYGNTLGMALYRNGQYAEARTVLEGTLARGKGQQDAWDLFPLAMCLHHLGDPKGAWEGFHRAVAWGKSQGASSVGNAHELAELQTETRRLLGLPD